ncbi:MAG: hypothetical protein M3340_04300 [Actinomycetota bacterium]|nr:hypothetical protein [Actinomycetota bacterium]
MGANGRNGGGPLGALLKNFGAVGAAIVGLLYLSGLLLKWSELRHAGVSVRDVLPQFPLEQILGTGLTLVAPALAGILVMVALLAALYGYELWLASTARRFQALRAPEVPEELRDEWTSLYDVSVEETAWDEIDKEMGVAQTAAEEAGDRARMKRLKRMRRRFRSFTMILLAFGSLQAVAYTVLFPAEVAVPGFILTPVLAIAVMAVMGDGRGGVQWIVIVYYALFAVLLVVATIGYPRGLPPVQVVTDNEGNVEGTLVLRTNTTWYLAVGDGVLRAVPNEHVECARVEPSPPRKRPMADLAPPEERNPLPRLTCPAADEDESGG